MYLSLPLYVCPVFIDWAPIHLHILYPGEDGVNIGRSIAVIETFETNFKTNIPAAAAEVIVIVVVTVSSSKQLKQQQQQTQVTNINIIIKRRRNNRNSFYSQYYFIYYNVILCVCVWVHSRHNISNLIN